MSDEPFSDFDQIYPPFGGLKDPTTAETPTMRYGVYVNGDLWAECSDQNRAELIMDACAATFSPSASFDVMPLNEPKD